MSESDCSLYRHFAADGKLLYVGISLDAIQRLRQHRCGADWYDDITRIDVEKFPTREAALAAESAAINTENPRHNKTLNLSERNVKVQTTSVLRAVGELDEGSAEWEFLFRFLWGRLHPIVKTRLLSVFHMLRVIQGPEGSLCTADLIHLNDNVICGSGGFKYAPETNLATIRMKRDALTLEQITRVDAWEEKFSGAS